MKVVYPKAIIKLDSGRVVTVELFDCKMEQKQ